MLGVFYLKLNAVYVCNGTSLTTTKIKNDVAVTVFFYSKEMTKVVTTFLKTSRRCYNNIIIFVKNSRHCGFSLKKRTKQNNRDFKKNITCSGLNLNSKDSAYTFQTTKNSL